VEIETAEPERPQLFGTETNLPDISVRGTTRQETDAVSGPNVDISVM